MTPPRHLLRLAAGAALTLAAGCGGDEVQATDDHTPVSYTVLVDGAPTTAPFALTQGRAVLVQLKFVNACNEDLDAVEGSHFGGLTFSPTSLATAARVAGHNYQFTVTGGTPGTGTVVVGFGHDAQADETSFPAAGVTVQAVVP